MMVSLSITVCCAFFAYFTFILSLKLKYITITFEKLRLLKVRVTLRHNTKPSRKGRKKEKKLYIPGKSQFGVIRTTTDYPKAHEGSLELPTSKKSITEDNKIILLEVRSYI